jgi:hypothetical protein
MRHPMTRDPRKGKLPARRVVMRLMPDQLSSTQHRIQTGHQVLHHDGRRRIWEPDLRALRKKVKRRYSVFESSAT